MMGALDGKIAIITGAGSGIGRASALRFAAAGAKLVIGDKTAAVHETAKLVKDAGGAAVAQIGRAHVCTPVPHAHLVCRLLLDTNNCEAVTLPSGTRSAAALPA